MTREQQPVPPISPRAGLHVRGRQEAHARSPRRQGGRASAAQRNQAARHRADEGHQEGPGDRVTMSSEGGMRMDYPVNLEPDDNGTFLAEIPDVPGAVSFGATEAEALENVGDALATVLSALISD